MKCPRIKRVALSKYRPTWAPRVRAFKFITEDGWLRIVQNDDGHYHVDNIFVEHKQRQGIGTCLYQAAAKFVCGEGRQLYSGKSRTEASDGFWAKQGRKGRAICVRCPKSETEANKRLNTSFCASGCRRWVLKPCETTLSGRRKRK